MLPLFPKCLRSVPARAELGAKKSVFEGERNPVSGTISAAAETVQQQEAGVRSGVGY